VGPPFELFEISLSTKSASAVLIFTDKIKDGCIPQYNPRNKDELSAHPSED
jgi:hypothetical protein